MNYRREVACMAYYPHDAAESGTINRRETSLTITEELNNTQLVRSIASAWHGGQWSPLYALASSGAIIHGCIEEVAECVRAAERIEPDDVSALIHLLEYVTVRGLRGPVEGWHNISL